MGKTNRTAALESKIVALLGECEPKRQEITKAERLVEAPPSMRERLWEIDEQYAKVYALQVLPRQVGFGRYSIMFITLVRSTSR